MFCCWGCYVAAIVAPVLLLCFLVVVSAAPVVCSSSPDCRLFVSGNYLFKHSYILLEQQTPTLLYNRSVGKHAC